MTYKQIEQARETRLWIGQVIVPVLTGAAIAVSNPQVRSYAKEKFYTIKNKIKKH